ncbi:MAG: SDR family NAD(P)-dependent oxidoreductase, partial [Betaproteobacteria bacterium]|nr:SDR family NAD(P)-dependent oxidoreductase [Betaproteobacteria bacterium]
MSSASILVTGGAGFIGSHTCVELLLRGFKVTVLDNLCNSKAESLARVERIAGRSLTFVNADVRGRAALDRVFADQKFDAVIHFAGLKSVGESVAKPLQYYENNVQGTLTL